MGKVRVLGVGIRCDPGCVTAAGLSSCNLSHELSLGTPSLPCLDRFFPLGGAGGSGEGKRLELWGDGSRLAPLGVPTAATRLHAPSDLSLLTEGEGLGSSSREADKITPSLGGVSTLLHQWKQGL